MTLTNWLKAGRQGRNNTKVILNIYANPKGQVGNSKWEDYVQFKLYSKEKERFVRLTMTKEEAILLSDKLIKELSRFKEN